MKIVFDRKKDDLSVPVPPAAPILDKAVSEKRDVSVGGKRVISKPAPEQPEQPVQPEQQVSRPDSPVSDEIEYLKEKYLNVFGLDSLVPSNRDVLELNLLFAIYSELVGLLVVILFL